MLGVVAVLAVAGATVGGCGGESMRQGSRDDGAGTGGTSGSMGGTGNVGMGGTGNAGTCERVACTTADCPDGARPILKQSDCCPVCPEPDLEACETSADCTLAISLSDCCACPFAVSVRHAALDRCVIATDEAPTSDSACFGTCPTIPCGVCPNMVAGAACIRGECEPTYIGG